MENSISTLPRGAESATIPAANSERGGDAREAGGLPCGRRQEEDGDGFSDISDSELLALEEEAMIDTRCDDDNADTSTDLHQDEMGGKELELHDVVSVTTQTREDVWALKCLNTITMIPVLQAGGRVREFPVFGELEGVFLVGVIDELGYSPRGELELRELKTRANPSLPGSAQRRSHNLQVSVYKLLFDGMVSGILQPEIFIHHLLLRHDQALGPQVKEHAKRVGFTISSFKDLLELTCLNLTFSNLPKIDCLKLEYCYQEDSTSLGCELVNFEEEKVMKQLSFFLSYWKGTRELLGVDIEEAWKCRTCDFADICEWRTTKSKEAAERNQTKRAK
ncbi:exonuclease V isoform X2 [Ascaphus truei]|uniref:exonuclease V isoform X2 n=1 Tax=Ascaphus truei TaxID=8439 RepID=UPI003F59915F